MNELRLAAQPNTADITARHRAGGARLPAALAALLVAAQVSAHSVHQREMSLVLSEETIAMLEGRAQGTLPGGAGLRNGDVIHVLFQSTPIPNNATQGAGAYMTVYVPPGFEVVDAGIIDWSAGFIFESIPPQLQGPMSDGWGSIGHRVDPAGSLAALYADTGLFYSSDPRTAYAGPLAPAPAPSAAGQLLPLMGQASALVYNAWDRAMVEGYNGDLPSMGGRGHTPFGYGSVVAGPDTYYRNDYRLCGGAYCANGDPAAEGPWQRIHYGGSRKGSGPVATSAGVVGQVGVATYTGWNLSPGNPLPAGTNAVRYALGERTFGLLETVRLSLRLVDQGQLDGNGCFEMHGDVFGGDASGYQDGKDHPWRYAVPGHANFSSCLYLYKQGPLTVSPGSDVTYTIDWKNLSARTMTAATLRDVIDTANATYLTANPTPTTVALPNLTWNLGDLAPGAVGQVQVTVRMDANPGDEFTVNTAELTCVEYPVPFKSRAVSLFGEFPRLAAAKSVTPGGADPNGIVTYTITLTNVGLGATAPDLSVDDVLPAGFTYIAGSSTQVAGPSCPFSAALNRPWNLTLPQGLCAGDALTITFQARVGAAVPAGTYYNSITYSYDDPAGIRTTNASAGGLAPVTVGLPSFNDLTLAASDTDGGELLPGDTLCYTLGVHNEAPTAGATNVVAIVPLPPFAELETATVNGDGASVDYSSSGAAGPFTYVPASPFDATVTHIRFSWAAVAAGSTRAPGFCVRLDRPLEDNTELVIQASLTTTQTGTTVFPSNDPGTVPDHDPTAVLVRARPDLSTSVKTADPTAAAPGQTVTYTIRVSDTGYNAVGATNVVVADTVDITRLDNVVIGPLPPGVTAGYVAPTIYWTIQNVPNNGSVEVTFTATIRDPFPGGGGAVDNVAEMRADQTPFWVATPAATVQVGRPDYSSSSKDASPTAAPPGATILYTIHVRDTGTSGVGSSNLTVTDTIDVSQLENIVLGAMPPGVSGVYNSPVITWTIASLPAGGSVDLTFTADVQAGASGTISNAAHVRSVEQPGGYDTPAVDVAVGRPDYTSSTKDASPRIAAPGATILYTIHVRDTGTSGVGSSNLTVTDTIDVGKLEDVVLGAMPPGVSGVYNPPVITWTIASLPAGGSVDLTFTADVQAGASGTISNAAHVRSVEQPAGYDTPAVDVAVGRPDYTSSTKDASPRVAAPGATILYTIHVRDTGTSGIGSSNLTVTDTIDTSKLENVVLGAMPPGVSGVYNPPVITWTIASLPAGGNVDLTFTADVRADANGTISNAAQVRSLEQPSGYQTPAVDVEVGRPDYTSSTKDALPTVAPPGSTIVYTIHVRDSGASGIGSSNLTVTDTIDVSQLENIVLGAMPPGVSGVYNPPVITWTVAALAAGTDLDLTFTADISAGVTGTILNAAVVRSDQQPAGYQTPAVVVTVDSPCVAAPPAVDLLKGVKRLPAADWTWQGQGTALDGYRVYSVVVKSHLPPDGTNPRALECSTAQAADLACSDADAFDAGSASLIFYQTAARCGSFEGAF